MADAPPSRPPGPPRSRMRMYQFGGGAAVVAVLVAAGAFFLLGGGDSEGAGNANPTNTPTVEGVSTSSSELEVVTPTAGPTNTPTVPPPTATPTLAPNTSRITDVRVAAGRYEVEFETAGFAPAVPGQHVHFFFDTVPPEQAGVPGAGPWILYGGPSPFTQYSPADRPAGASQMCILVANPDHSVNQGTGNCVDLPD